MLFLKPVRLMIVLGAMSASVVGQQPQGDPTVVRSDMTDAETPPRAYPRINLDSKWQLEYVGAFAADGTFKRLSRFDRAVDAMITASVPYGAATRPEHLASSTKVQPCLNPNKAREAALRAHARPVGDVEPPARMVELVHGRSVFAGIGDLIVRIVSGTDRILCTPQAVTTDSRQRVVITDPAAHAVHVLDSGGNDSFHIFGGQDRRLQSPAGVAIDRDDNIYVSDTERGMVLVYSSEGRFLRYIGTFKGESMYQRPSGIAIHRTAGRLYVLDTPLHSLYIHDLQGQLLARIGKRGGGSGPGEFTRPTAIIVHGEELMVMDNGGSRIQVLDLQGHFRKQFNIEPAKDSGRKSSQNKDMVEAGLSVDSSGHIYVTDTQLGLIRVYDAEGSLVSSFGRPGRRVGEFQSISGMWADAQDRLYIANANQAPLQIFQFGPAEAVTTVPVSKSNHRKQKRNSVRDGR